MEEIVKVAAVALVAALLAVLLKKDNPVGAYLVSGGAMIVIIVFVTRLASPLIDFMEQLSDTAGMSPAVVAPLFKTLGISILTKIAAETCREAAQPAVAAYMEIAGQAAALYVALPLLSAVLVMVKSFMS